MRELVAMVEGRQRDEWAKTSELLAMIYNMNRPPKAKVIQSWKLNPFGRPPAKGKAAQMPGRQSWAMFKKLCERGAFGVKGR